jgi:hypothetical protein
VHPLQTRQCWVLTPLIISVSARVGAQWCRNAPPPQAPVVAETSDIRHNRGTVQR